MAAAYSPSGACPAAAALAATSPARAPDRSAKLMPSLVHGSSSPAASPATMTRPLRSGEVVRTAPGQVPRVADYLVSSQPQALDEIAQVFASSVALLARPWLARPCHCPVGSPGRDHANGQPVALGEDPAVGRGDLPQSSRTRPAQCRWTGAGTAISSSSPRSTWSNVTPTCRAVIPADPSAPTATDAVTVDPSPSLTVAWSSSWEMARPPAAGFLGSGRERPLQQCGVNSCA